MRSIHRLDKEAMYAAAAEHVAARSEQCIRDTGRFTIALTGGESPGPLYRRLAQDFRERIDWSHWEVFWGDERCVPPDSPDSNYRLARETLLDHVPIPAPNIHRMRGEDDPHHAAAAYEREVKAAFSAGPSAFDLILLGMGADGHVASLFPASEGLKEKQRLVIANFAPPQKAWRITFTFPLLKQAKEVLFLVTTPEKREALEAALRPGRPTVPAARVQPVAGEVHWYISTDVGLDEGLAE